MAVTSVRVNPASGDDHTTIFKSSDSDSEPIGTVEKGTILKVTGKSNGYYKVALTHGGKGTAIGGGGDTGVTFAIPYTFLYNNPEKHKSLGRLNNGTKITIIGANEDSTMLKVTGVTTNGTKTGWVEARYVYRSNLKATSTEEGES